MADVSVFKMLKVIVLQEKAISEYLNMLKVEQGSQVATGLVWCPRSYDFEGEVANIISRLGVKGSISCDKIKNDGMLRHPTLFRTNEFLWPFQQLTNTYGIPTY